MFIKYSSVLTCILIGTSAYAGGMSHEPAQVDAIGQITVCSGSITKHGKTYHAKVALLADFNQFYCGNNKGADGIVLFKGDLDGMIIGHWDAPASGGNYVFHSHESASAETDAHDCRGGGCAPNLYDFSKLSVRFIDYADPNKLDVELSSSRLSAIRFSCVSDATSQRQCVDPDKE